MKPSLFCSCRRYRAAQRLAADSRKGHRGTATPPTDGLMGLMGLMRRQAPDLASGIAVRTETSTCGVTLLSRNQGIDKPAGHEKHESRMRNLGLVRRRESVLLSHVHLASLKGLLYMAMTRPRNDEPFQTMSVLHAFLHRRET